MKSVFCSIVNFRGRDNTLVCLGSIEKAAKDKFNLNVVVVDNGSQENLRLPKYSFNLKILESKENLGFSGGHNLGIKYALENGANYVLVLNNDIIVHKGLIT